MSVTTRREGDVGHVEIDAPPVNAIGRAVREGLLDAVRWAERERLERVIVAGRGAAFAAGADAREFDAAPVEPHLPDVLDAIERSAVPWIAAIDGVALGGGAEIALACRMRIAAPGARVGFPEVTLGLVPGAGGTQRLPRLVGFERALEMVAGGRPIGAHEALGIGLVHAVEDDPVDAAFMVNAEALDTTVPVRDLPAPEVDAGTVATARERAARRSPGQLAPARAVEVIERGLALPFDEALALEREAFLELRASDQARALRHVFFAERAAKAPADLIASPVALDHVAVVGGGTMGAGIACALLEAGGHVTVLETDGAGAERAGANVDRLLEATRARGLIDADGVRERRARLVSTVDPERLAGATLAVEAASESMDVKREVFAALEHALPPGAVLATNTSYLDVDEIAGTVADPSRVVGLHFFAPAHVMKLLEIVRGARTGDVALATGFALAKRLRKVPVVVGVCDGFVGNRILARYREAADTVLIDGSTPWEIDEAMVGFGYAMGPYAAQDLSGLDVAHANRRRQDATRDPARRYVPIADRMVELGKLGRKTGAGWYRYPGGEGRVEDPIVADLAIEEARFAGIERREYAPDEIRERLVLAMINEAADVLDEGVARSARDVDLVTVLGYGFPRWRGGLMHHADALGAGAIVERLEALGEEDPVAWRVSPLLRRCAEAGTPIAEAGPRP